MLRKHPLTPPGLSRKRRGQIVAVLVAVAATVLVTAQSASAAPFFSDSSNPPYSSDPHLAYCNDFGTKLCLYASVDEGNGSAGSYPMRRTKLWTINSGLNWKTASNWTYVGVVATEDAIRSMDINPRTSHFWAPAGFRHDGRNYLFVPDLYNGNNNTGSRVYVFDAPSETGTYDYRGRIDTGSTLNGGYASDPFVLRDYDGSVYMFFANGNDTNCGGVSRTRLASDNLLSASNTVRITFTGLQADLGRCGNGDPYIEGPAVYSRYHLYDLPGRWPSNFSGIGDDQWIMMFSVKPNGRIPARTNPTSVRCSTDAQQALAYATAPSLTSTTWTYRGIIMCPRGQEWTNHGSLIRWGSDVILAFHDGPSNFHRRRVMLDCLTWSSNGALKTVPVSDNNAANCNNW